MSELRKYYDLAGFNGVVRSVTDLSKIDSSKLAIAMPAPTEIKALGSEDSRMIEFTITTDRVDRDQDTLDPDGWDLKDYENNPVVMWCHDHYVPVIGNSRSISRVGNQIRSIAEFTPQDLNPFGYMIYRMYREKFMHACSVGFEPFEYTMAADRKYGINYKRMGLLEYSCVPVGSNPDALSRAKSFGIDLNPLFHWTESLLDTKSGSTDEARRQLEHLRGISAPSGRALILELGDMKMAGNEPKDKDNPPSSTSAIKAVERWECGTDGHTHKSKVEAEGCANFDVSVTDATKSLQLLAALVKSGRTIKTEAAALIRSVVEELAPSPKKAACAACGADPGTNNDCKTCKPEGTETEIATGDDLMKSIGEMSEDVLRELVSGAVTEKVNELTGRVD